MARPPDVVSGQFITAEHINAIKNSVYDWQGDMDGNGFSILDTSRIDIGAGGQFGLNGIFAAYSNAGSRGASVLVQDTVNTVAGSGGALLFGAPFAFPWYAGIKGSATSGSGNSQGDIVFMTRADPAWAHIQEMVRITSVGSVGIGTPAPLSKLQITEPTENSFRIASGSAPTEVYTIGRNVSTGYLTFNGLQDTSSGFRFVTTGASGGEVMRITNNGRVGLGNGSPGGKIHTLGLGQASSLYSQSGPHEASMILQDSGLSPNSGGALLLGAGFGAGYFCGIKAAAVSGADQSVGDMVFVSRVATGNLHLSEVMRIGVAGAITIPFLPSSNPGAGSRQIWFDPADGNRVKFAA